jgi:hypothetical protein
MSDDPIDQANRFVISVLALVVVFASLIVIVLAWGASSSSISAIEDFAGYLRDHDERPAKAVVTLGAVVVILLMLMTMIVQLTPSPLQRMRLRNVKSGDASLTTSEIAWRVEEEVRKLEHVAECEAIVAARGNRVEVALDVHVDAAADLARLADEACRRAHLLVEETMSVPLASRPRARMHYRELRLKDGDPRIPEVMRRPQTGWERPSRPTDGGEHDDRGTGNANVGSANAGNANAGSSDAPEEAQA